MTRQSSVFSALVAMMHSLVATLLLCSGCAGSNSSQIDRIVLDHMEARRIPGVTIGIVREDGSVLTRAYGLAVVEHGVRARVDTVYEIASLTKQFTAAAVLLCCEDGLLSLDDPVSDSLLDAPGSWEGITLRHLLTHTAGLPPDDEEFATLRGDWRRYSTRELMLASAFADRVSGEPGESFEYGSMAYFIAAIVVERVSGMTFREYMRERFFEPLGMTQTLLHDELAIVPHEATGYSIKDGRLVKIWRDSVEEVAGGWGMYSSVPDLVRWELALRGDSFLSEASRRDMWTPARLNDGSRFRYGLGWWLPVRNGIPYEYHSGVTGTEFLRIPSRGIAVIVLTNLGQSDSVGAGEALPWGLADAIASVIVPGFAAADHEVPIDGDRLLEYAGRWSFDDGEARFFPRDGRLWIDDKVGTEPMQHRGHDTFGFPGEQELLVFDRDESGAVRSARWVSETWQDVPGVRLSRD